MSRLAAASLIVLIAVAPVVAQAPKKSTPQQMAEAAKALNQFGCKLHFDEKAAGGPLDLIWFPPKTTDGEVARLVGHAARFPQLKAVDLGDTQITDVCLKELGKLSNLESVYLDNTAVTDAGVKALAAVERLAWLDLSNTKATTKSVETLAQFKSLNHLFLNKGEASASDVERIVTLNRLRSLGLQGISPDSVKELGKLGDLKDLRLNRLGRMGVVELGNLKGLESLRLGAGLGYIDADGWKALADLPKLSSLELGNHAPDDWKAYVKWRDGKKEQKGRSKAFPAASAGLADLNGLKRLDLTGMPIGDDSFKVVAKLGKLEELSVCCSLVTFEGAKDLAGLSKLQRLNARNCMVTDLGLKSLESLKDLKVLQLYDNPISESGVKQLQRALPRCAIYWKYDKGTGDHRFRVPGGYGG